MKKTMLLSVLCMILLSCGANNSKDQTAQGDATAPKAAAANPAYDPNRGEGKFKHVDISPTLNQSLADNGKKVYDLKCSSCHKLTAEKLVGPGWQGVTIRHAPEWIMNFVTNTDEMITKDPKAQAMLELCLVRMPNQNLNDDDVKAIYEFMRKNDGTK